MPVVLEYYGDWLDCFYDASSERQIGMGYGQVPFSAIERQAQRIGLIGEAEFEIFLSVMRTLDGIYLAHMNERTEDGKGRPKKQKVSTREASPQLISALFGR